MKITVIAKHEVCAVNLTLPRAQEGPDGFIESAENRRHRATVHLLQVDACQAGLGVKYSRTAEEETWSVFGDVEGVRELLRRRGVADPLLPQGALKEGA